MQSSRRGLATAAVFSLRHGKVCAAEVLSDVCGALHNHPCTEGAKRNDAFAIKVDECYALFSECQVVREVFERAFAGMKIIDKIAP